MANKLFCGIEGGASVSKLILMTGCGEELCSVDGSALNYLLSGTAECQRKIAEMIEQAKTTAGIPKGTVLDGLGLCMSGCEAEVANVEFQEQFMQLYPKVTKICSVTSDVYGPLYTVSSEGGLVLIAGTGSNSFLINPDGTTARCGGWGHLIGDEASAAWISLKAVKTVIDQEDNLVVCPFDITMVKKLILQHFDVKDKFGIIEHCYSKFNKTFFALLCKKLAETAKETHDPLCCHLFYEAGRVLGAMAAALSPNVHPELLKRENGVPVVCVGSVFKSWPLLQKGFIDGINKKYKKCTLVTLTRSSSIGAAYLGAKASGFNLPIDYAGNTSVLFKYTS